MLTEERAARAEELLGERGVVSLFRDLGEALGEERPDLELGVGQTELGEANAAGEPARDLVGRDLLEGDGDARLHEVVLIRLGLAEPDGTVVDGATPAPRLDGRGDELFVQELARPAVDHLAFERGEERERLIGPTFAAHRRALNDAGDVAHLARPGDLDPERVDLGRVEIAAIELDPGEERVGRADELVVGELLLETDEPALERDSPLVSARAQSLTIAW